MRVWDGLLFGVTGGLVGLFMYGAWGFIMGAIVADIYLVSIERVAKIGK